MKSSALLIAIALVVLLAGSFLLYKSPFVQSRLASPEVARIKTAGKLVAGIDPTYPPMESVDADGKMIGFDVDFAREIAKEMGVSLETKYVAWNDFFPAVNRGDVDIAISSITITPERSEIVTFTNPYFASGQAIVKRANDATITSPLTLAGKRVAAQKDTTSGQEAIKYTDPSLVTLYETDYVQSVQNVQNGQLDGLIIDFPAGADIVGKNPDVAIAAAPFTSEFYGIAVKKGNVELAGEINNIIAKLKQSGKFEEVKKQWFP